MNPRPMRLGGVPMGVARPPTDDAKATQSRRPVAKAGAGRCPVASAASSIAASMPMTIVNIIAVVHVLEMKAVMHAQTTATAVRIRRGRPSTQGSDSTP